MPAPDALTPLKRRDGDPVFEEAWQAQALAMADTLVKAGVFSAADWAGALGVAVSEGDADDTGAYYAAVLRALERLLAERGAVPPGEMTDRRDAWASAYENTPHGDPVALSAGNPK